jgi:hypothetical protein
MLQLIAEQSLFINKKFCNIDKDMDMLVRVKHSSLGKIY